MAVTWTWAIRRFCLLTVLICGAVAIAVAVHGRPASYWTGKIPGRCDPQTMVCGHHLPR